MIYPTYTITFPMAKEAKFNKAKDIPISSRVLTPSDEKISPLIFELLDALSQDYVFALGQNFNGAFTGQIRFSLEKGITCLSCNDERIKRILEEELKEVNPVAIKKNKKQKDLNCLKKIQPTQDQKQRAIEQLGKNVLFVDYISYQLWNQQILKDIVINLKITGFKCMGKGGGCTTGMLRYPHLLQDLFTRFSRTQTPRQVCLVGPGLLEEPKQSFCPQFVEIYSLFPEAKFLILDHNQQALDVMQQQFHRQFAMYDLMMFRLRSIRQIGHISNRMYAPLKYQTLFQSMKEVFIDKALAPPGSVKEMLEGIGALKPLMLKVQADNIRLQNFDIVKSEMPEADKRQYDIVVATKSIYLTLFDHQHDVNLDSMIKFLNILKEDGSLYVDITVIKHFKDVYELEGFPICIQYWEAKIGNKLTLENIPLSDFLLENLDDEGLIDHITVHAVNAIVVDEKPNNLLSTSSLTVITRTSEKVIKTLEEQEGLRAQLNHYICK